MAVTEYVGPIVAQHMEGEWSSANSYESLAVVTNEGNSYTARQDVPVGVELTNEDYWVETGNWNAQIEAYRQEVLTAQSVVNEITPFDTTPTEGSTKGVTSGGVQAALAEITPFDTTPTEGSTKGVTSGGVQAALAEITNDYKTADTALNTRVTALEDRGRILIFGDSWAAFSNGFANWATTVSNNLNIPYTSYGIGGSGFLRASNGSTFATEVETAHNEYPSDVSYVFLIGGVNDLNYNFTNTQIQDSFKSLCAIINSYWPTAKKYAIIGNPIYPYDYGISTTALFRKCCSLNHAIMRDDNGWDNLSQWTIIPYTTHFAFGQEHNLNALYTTDGFHLSNVGAKRISAYFLNAIQGTALSPKSDITFKADSMNYVVKTNGYIATLTGGTSSKITPTAEALTPNNLTHTYTANTPQSLPFILMQNSCLTNLIYGTASDTPGWANIYSTDTQLITRFELSTTNTGQDLYINNISFPIY